jgi:hypothetical protein
MTSLSWSPPARVVPPADRPSWPWQRGWIADALRARESVVVARRSSIETVLCVDDGSLQLRHSFRRLTTTASIRRVRCLGIVGVSVPWYAGIAFSGRSELRSIVERSECSVLLVRDGQQNGRSR